MKHIHDEEPPLPPSVMAALRDPSPSHVLQERTLRALREDGAFAGHRATAGAARGLELQRKHSDVRVYTARAIAIRAIAAGLIFAAGAGAGSWAAHRSSLVPAPAVANSGGPSATVADRIQTAAQSYVGALALADSGASRAAALTSFRLVIEQMTRIIPGGQPGASVSFAMSNGSQTSPTDRASKGSLLWY